MKKKEKKCQVKVNRKCCHVFCRKMATEKSCEESPRKANRASIEEVRTYYTEYVDIKGIRKYFRCVRAHARSSPSGHVMVL